MRPLVDAHRVHVALTKPSEIRRDLLLKRAEAFFADLARAGVSNRDVDVAKVVILTEIRQARL